MENGIKISKLEFPETDDEGIGSEDDPPTPNSSGPGGGGGGIRASGCARRVMDLCAGQLSAGAEAGAHFRNVCRAIVSEALELSR